MLSSKDLIRLLERANSLRNRWKGHDKAETDEEAKEQHQTLRDLVEELRSLVGLTFRQYELIKPGKNEAKAGPIYVAQVTRMMGSNPQLERGSVTIKTLPEKGLLYLHNTGHDEALKLLPTMRLREAPQPATYFYNGGQKLDFHFVSYHQADQSEIFEGDKSLIELFERFEQSGDSDEEVG